MFKTINEEAFRNDLLLSPFFNDIEMESDVDLAIDTWYSLFLSVLDKHAHIKKKRVKSYN